MKCDGLPDPVCVRELNTYLSLWKEDDTREDIDQVYKNIWNTNLHLFSFLFNINIVQVLLSHQFKICRYWREQWRFCQ